MTENRLTIALPLMTVVILSCVSNKVVAQQKNRPNIIYIMCDDHAFQAISAYESALAKVAPTPNIDRIAQNGMIFDRAFVENSLSAPSRACLITGLYSHQNGQEHLFEGIDSTKTFFTEILHNAGYSTGLIGKWHLMCKPKGFDYFHILDDQGKYYNPTFCSNDSYGKYTREEGYATDLITEHAIEFLDKRDKKKPFMLMVHHKAPHRNWLPNLKYLGAYDNVEFPIPETFFDDYATRGEALHEQKATVANHMEMVQDLKIPELYDSNSVASRASFGALMGEIGRMTAEQRAVWDAYYMPRNFKFIRKNYSGHELAKWKLQTYLRDYMSVIKSIDESVGRILDYLDHNGLTDNTMIVYTSDQGFYMGEHGLFDKRWMYEESMRTPLIISWPGHIAPGTRCSQLVQNIDFAPTFLSVAGIKKPNYMPGLSLEPLFVRGTAEKWRKSLYYHYYDYPTFHLVRKHDGVRTERYKLIHFYGKGGKRGAAENKYMLQQGTNENRVFHYLENTEYFPKNSPDVDYYELYDLQSDPHELNNIYGKTGYEQITRKLTKELYNYRKRLKVKEY